MSKKIILTKGKYAIVDNEDFEYLNQWKWTLHSNGYAYRSLSGSRKNRKFIFMHRFILLTPIGLDTDHINHNKLDNRKKNLRVATRRENNMNSKLHKTNTSGYRGVSWCKELSKWRAQVSKFNRGIHLGYFKNIQDAIKAYKSYTSSDVAN